MPAHPATRPPGTSTTTWAWRARPGGAVDAGDGARFSVDLADGRQVRARRLVVTTGLVDELPPVPGLAQRWGVDVLHCPYCHGYEVADQAVGILATGPGAVHQALLFRQLTADVTVFAHTAPDLSEEHLEQLAARGVAVVEGEVAGLEVTDDALSGVRLAGGRVVPRRALVVATHLSARSGLLECLGLEPVEVAFGGHVTGTWTPVEPFGATAVAGVHVAGNVTDLMAQVLSSAAAGPGVGAAVNADLITEDTPRAVAALRAGDHATPTGCGDDARVLAAAELGAPA